MRFPFEEEKTAQAAAYLVSLNGGHLNYMVLIKLLYLSDRQALIDTGVPITGDRMVAMPHGPVLSSTLDLINMGAPQHEGATPWYQYLTEPTDYEVRTTRETGLKTDELSQYEMGILKAVFAKFGRMNKWALRDYTHGLPEWVDPQGSSFPIDPRKILESEGRSEDDVAEIVSDAEEVWFMRTLERA